MVIVRSFFAGLLLMTGLTACQSTGGSRAQSVDGGQGPGGLGAGCGRGFPCAEPLRCVDIGATDAPGICVEPNGGSVGEGCGRGFPCAAPLTCLDIGANDSPGHCEREAAPAGCVDIRAIRLAACPAGSSRSAEGCAPGHLRLACVPDVVDNPCVDISAIRLRPCPEGTSRSAEGCAPNSLRLQCRVR